MGASLANKPNHIKTTLLHLVMYSPVQPYTYSGHLRSFQLYVEPPRNGGPCQEHFGFNCMTNSYKILTCFIHLIRQASHVQSENNCTHWDFSTASTDVMYTGQGARWSSNQWPQSSIGHHPENYHCSSPSTGRLTLQDQAVGTFQCISWLKLDLDS